MTPPVALPPCRRRGSRCCCGPAHVRGRRWVPPMLLWHRLVLAAIEQRGCKPKATGLRTSLLTRPCSPMHVHWQTSVRSGTMVASPTGLPAPRCAGHGICDSGGQYPLFPPLQSMPCLATSCAPPTAPLPSNHMRCPALQARLSCSPCKHPKPMPLGPAPGGGRAHHAHAHQRPRVPRPCGALVGRGVLQAAPLPAGKRRSDPHGAGELAACRRFGWGGCQGPAHGCSESLPGSEVAGRGGNGSVQQGAPCLRGEHCCPRLGSAAAAAAAAAAAYVVQHVHPATCRPPLQMENEYGELQVSSLGP